MRRGIVLSLLLCAGCGGREVACRQTPEGCPVVINELFAWGRTKDSPDWVELKNRSSADVVITGYRLGDADGHELLVPEGTTVPAGKYLLVHCWRGSSPAEDTAKTIHAPFQLNRDQGDGVVLLAPDGPVDAAAFGDALPDTMTWGRHPDGTGGFRFLRPTPDAENR